LHQKPAFPAKDGLLVSSQSFSSTVKTLTFSLSNLDFDKLLIYICNVEQSSHGLYSTSFYVSYPLKPFVMEDIEICHYNNVMKSKIIKAIKEKGLTSVKRIQDVTDTIPFAAVASRYRRNSLVY
jgi:NAD(P)H-nitrite reductase